VISTILVDVAFAFTTTSYLADVRFFDEAFFDEALALSTYSGFFNYNSFHRNLICEIP